MKHSALFPLFTLLSLVFSGCATKTSDQSKQLQPLSVATSHESPTSTPSHPSNFEPGMAIEFSDLPTGEATDLQVVWRDGYQYGIVKVPGYETPFLIYWPPPIKGEEPPPRPPKNPRARAPLSRAFYLVNYNNPWPSIHSKNYSDS